jgi:hypothetical protein
MRYPIRRHPNSHARRPSATSARTVRQPRTHFGGRQRSNGAVVTQTLIAVNVVAFMLQAASVQLERQLTLCRRPSPTDSCIAW